MNKDLNLALIPLTIEWNAVEENLERLEEMAAAVHPDTDLIVLPETFATGFPTGQSREEIMAVTAEYQHMVLDRLKAIAAQKNMAICGTTITLAHDTLQNAAFFVEPNGEVTMQGKRHLFTMAGEDRIFTPGTRRLKVRYRGWNIAMAVCYDLRFPVWTRNVANEYDLLIYPANWPVVRVSAWDALLPARAIENEAYVCGVNCKGTDAGGFEYNGSSHLIDYKGKEIATDTGQGILYATLSRKGLDTFREKFPAWKEADAFRLG